MKILSNFTLGIRSMFGLSAIRPSAMSATSATSAALPLAQAQLLAKPQATAAPPESPTVILPTFNGKPWSGPRAIKPAGLTEYQAKVQHDARLKLEFGFHEKLKETRVLYKNDPHAQADARAKVLQDYDAFVAMRPTERERLYGKGIDWETEEGRALMQKQKGYHSESNPDLRAYIPHSRPVAATNSSDQEDDGDAELLPAKDDTTMGDLLEVLLDTVEKMRGKLPADDPESKGASAEAGAAQALAKTGDVGGAVKIASNALTKINGAILRNRAMAGATPYERLMPGAVRGSRLRGKEGAAALSIATQPAVEALSAALRRPVPAAAPVAEAKTSPSTFQAELAALDREIDAAMKSGRIDHGLVARRNKIKSQWIEFNKEQRK
jgi:hypothetical protein